MITLFNPTNETMEMMFAGIRYAMEPPPATTSKMNVEDPCGRHLLNAFAQRGLCQLMFGDDEKVVGQAGVERNMEFKKVQVLRYNMNNEQRKMAGLGYMPPTKEIKKYSLDLGIGLLEPYTIKDAELTSIATAHKENTALKGELEDMRKENAEIKTQLGQLLTYLKSQESAKKEPAKIDFPKGKG